MKGSKYHIKRDDRVMVIAGSEKGKIGKVLKVYPKKDRAVVERVNMIKRHSRPSTAAPQGGIIEKEGPINICNLKVVCGKCSEPTRTGVKTLEDGQRVRVCKSCGEMIDQV
jgi:large subunit ribosomal protein L24